MSIEPGHLDEIEKYLQNGLSASEKKAFEEKMSHDPSLAAEVENHRTAIFLIRTGGIQSLKKELDSYSVYAPAEKEESKLRSINKWYFWAAASVALVAVVILVTSQRQPDVNELFITYYTTPTADRQIVRDGLEVDEKTQAFLDYDQGHYNEALVQFENMLLEKPGDSELLFYAGAAALSGNQPAKAIRYFTELLKDPDTIYQTRAHWYLSLACLKEGELEKCKQYLRALERNPNSYSSKAKELLNELD